MILKALFAAIQAHRGQKDKGGKAYLFHPIRVALNCTNKDAKVAALLHDVVEDTDYNIGKLKLSKVQMKALDLLTHNPQTPYMEYIEKIKDDPIAKEVKLSDLRDNMNLNRLKTITQKDPDRVDKYKKAYKMLTT